MSRPNYGETWVYEGIIGAIPGLQLRLRTALGAQFVIFEAAVLLVAWLYQLPSSAILAGTLAVAVTTVGSATMVSIARTVRSIDGPAAYSRVLLGSSIEVALAVLSYAGLITYLFVLDGPTADDPFLESLLGSEPPALAVMLALVILWDVCYRVSVDWWASLTALWRALTLRFDAETTRTLRRVDATTAGYGLIQLSFLPLVWGHQLLVYALVGHVLAVLCVTGSATLLQYRK